MRLCPYCKTRYGNDGHDCMEKRALLSDDIGEVTVESGNTKVSVEYIGEGISGDYEDDDSEDIPFVRFTVFTKKGNDFEAVQDASCCTQIDARSEKKYWVKLAELVLREIAGKKNIKRICERLSWTTKEQLG